MASFLLSLLKRGLKKDGVEVCVMQGGAVRGARDYTAGGFTMGDLFQVAPLIYPPLLDVIKRMTSECFFAGVGVRDSNRNRRNQRLSPFRDGPEF